MAKKVEKIYMVEIGYHDVCVGTLAQCQRVQAAIAACRTVDTAYLEHLSDDVGKQRVIVETEEGVVVKPCKYPVLTQEEFRRESTPKIGMTPSDQVKGGVV